MNVNSLLRTHWMTGDFSWPRTKIARRRCKRLLLERERRQKASIYPSSVRFRSGDGRRGEVRRAAGIPAGAAGDKGEFTALVLDVDIPA